MNKRAMDELELAKRQFSSSRHMVQSHPKTTQERNT